jgi:hypothetical protein
MGDATQPQREAWPGRARRRAAWVAALILALAVLAALARGAPALAEAGLRRAAQRLGFEHVALDVRGVGLGGIELADLRAGGEGELAADAVTLAWSARGLFARRLDRVAVRGLRVRAVWDEAGLRIPALAPLAEPSAEPAPPAALPALPTAALEIESARLELVGPERNATAELSGELRLAEDGVPERLRLELEASPWPPLLAAELSASADLVGDGAGGLRGAARAASRDGRLRADLALPGAGAPGRLSLAAVELPLEPLAPRSGVRGALSFELEGALAAAGGELALQLERCATLRLAGLALPGTGALARPFELCLEPHAGPILALGLSPPAERRARAELHLAPAAFEAALEAGGLALAGATPRSVIEAELPLEGEAPLVLRVVWREGELRAPPWLAPLALAGSLDARGEELRGVATLIGAGGALEVSLEAALAPGGDAELRARLAPLRFGPGRPAPAALVPALRGVADQATGELAGEARLWRRDGTLDAEAKLELRDLGFSGPGLRVSGVDGGLRLRGWPLATPGRQTLEIARVESGAAFDQVGVRFELRPDGALDLHELRASGLGGTLRAVGRLQAGAERQLLLLELDGIDLAQLFGALDVSGLSGEGVVAGATQLALVGGHAFFENGQLAAVGDGWLRYRPPGQAPPAYDAPQGLDLARAALYDFHYDRLSGTLGGQVDGELALSLRLNGANPNLYAGHPIDLELNLKGGLFGLFRSSRTMLTVPESLQRRLQERLER